MRKSGILIGFAVLCAGASLAVVAPADEPEVGPVLPGQEAQLPPGQDGTAPAPERRLIETADPALPSQG